MTAKKEELKMKIAFEPNRFSSNYLADAYEILAPTTKRLLPDSDSVQDKESVSVSIVNSSGEKL